MSKEFLMIGCGNMGSALLKGWLKADTLKNFSHIHVVKPSEPAAGSALSGVQYHQRLDAVKNPALVILAVKPKQCAAVLAECKQLYGVLPVYVSIAAGIELETLRGVLGDDAQIIRAMPNTPTEIGKGVTGLCASDATHSDAHGILSQLFSALGLAVWVKEEEMDVLTALCGSGPAYAYYFMECLAHAAKQLGIASVDADRLTRHMLLGASALAAETSKPLQQLRQEVTSPNGTTEAALKVWMQKGTLDLQAEQALQAALQRAREL